MNNVKDKRDEFETKHVEKNVRACSTRKDHHLAQVLSQFPIEYSNSMCKSAHKLARK